MANWWEEGITFGETEDVSTTESQESSNWLDDEITFGDQEVSERTIDPGEESYGVSSVEQPEEPGFFDQMVDPYVKGAKQAFYGMGQLGSNIYSGISAMMPEGHLGKEYFAELGESGRQLWEARKKAEDTSQYDKNLLDNIGLALDPSYWIYQGVKQAPIIGSAIIGGPLAAGLMGGGQIYNETYNAMIDDGASPENATLTGLANGIVGGALEKLGAKYVLEGGKIALRAVRGGVGEAGTEAAQTLQGEMTQFVTKALEDGKTTQEIEEALIDKLPKMAWEAGGAGLTGFGLGLAGGVVLGDTEGSAEIRDAQKQAKTIAALEAEDRKQKAQRLAKQVRESGEEPTSMEDMVKRIQQATDEREKPNITLGPEGAFKNQYDEKGNFVGRVPLARHVGVQRAVKPEAAHLTSKTAGQQTLDKIQVSLELESPVEREIKEANKKAGQELVQAIEMIDVGPRPAEEAARTIEEQPPTARMVAAERGAEGAEALAEAPVYTPGGFQPKGQPSTAEQAGEVLEPAGPYTPTTPAGPSAEVLEGAPVGMPGFQPQGQPSTAEEAAGTLVPEGPLESRFSEEEIQEVLSENSDLLDAIEAEIDANQPVSAAVIDQALDSSLATKSAEESMGVSTAQTDQIIADFREASVAMQENRTQEAIAAIKRAVKRKGKSAEKSAKYLEAVPDPATARVEQARTSLSEAIQSGNKEAIDQATDEFTAALISRDRQEGRDLGREEIRIEREPEAAAPRQEIQREEGGGYFDAATGTAEVRTASPEEVLEREQEGTTEELETEATPTKAGRVSKDVKDVVKHKEGGELTQAILDGNPEAISKALDKFPVADRKKAYDRASSDALAVAKGTGKYKVADVEYLVEEHKDKVKWQGKRAEGELVTKSLGNNIWQITNRDTGKTYNVFKHKGKYTVREGKETVGVHSSLKAAKESVKTGQALEYKVVDTGNKGQNRYEVHGPDGVVDPQKRTGGMGYRSAQAANQVAAELNEVEIAEKEVKEGAEGYSESAKDYAAGKKVKDTSKKPEKVSRRLVVKRKKETSTKGQVETKDAQRGTEEIKSEKRDFEIVKEWTEELDALSSVESTTQRQDATVARRLEGMGMEEFINTYGSKRLKATYKFLKAILPEGAFDRVVTNVSPDAHPLGTPGRYNTRSKKVTVNIRGSEGYFKPEAIAATWLHEAVHAVTAHQLRLPENADIVAELDTLRDSVSEKILSPFAYQIYQDFKNDPKGFRDWYKLAKGSGTLEDLGFESAAEVRSVYAMLSNDEFLANATHPDISKRLEALPATDSKTIKDKIKEFFKRIFGWKDKEYNAFSQVMAAIGRLNETQIDENVEAKAEEYFDLATHSLARQEANKDLSWLESFVQAEEEALQERIDSGELEVSEIKDQRTWFQKVTQEPAETFKDIAIGINERLEAINPAIAFKVRKEEGEMLRKNKDMQSKLSILQKEFKRIVKENNISKKQVERVKLALLNQEHDVAEALFKEDRKISKAYEQIKVIIKGIEQDLLDTGALRKEDVVEDYLWHREVADLDGLIKAMENDPNMNSVMKEIKEQLPRYKQMGMDEKTAKAKIVNDMMTTGRRPATMRTAKGTKQRRFTKVPPQYAKFYKDPFESLANHFEESNEVVAMRRILGTTPLVKTQKELTKLRNQYEKDPTQELKDQIDRMEMSVDQYTNSLEDSVSGFVGDLLESGKITTAQAAEVDKLIRGRITQHGISNGSLQKLRNAGLAMSLGHFSNTLTQLKDGSLIIYRHGLGRTAVSMAKAIMGKGDISAKNYDLQRVMNEFRTGSGFNLNTIFKLTGFTQLDNAMKTVNLQSHIDTLRKTANKDPQKIREKYELAWGKELTDQVIADLQSGQVTPDVKNIAITEMSKDVPVFLSEMPYAYNQGGNARIAYTLKSYAVKIFNVALRDGVKKITHGKNLKERAVGVKNLVALSLVLGFVGGGVEELKDLIIGRKTAFWENFSDELLNVVFLSRYALDNAAQRGPSEILKNMVSVPGLALVDVAYEALQGSPKGLRYVPLPGAKELYYRATDTGKQSVLNQNRRGIFGRMKEEAQSTGRISRGLNKDIREFNKEAVKYNRGIKKETDKIKPITFQTIKRNVRRFKKEKRQKELGLASVVEGVAEVLGPREAYAEDIPEYWTANTEAIINKHFPRLAKGMDPMKAFSNLDKFVQLVAQAESSGNLKAKNPESTAEGMFQFLDDSIEPAMKRLARMIGWQDWMKQVVKDKNVSTLTYEQQVLMFLAQMFELKGTDKYMKGVLQGKVSDMTAAYYKFHHTKPDDKTRKNWNRTVKNWKESSRLLGDG